MTLGGAESRRESHSIGGNHPSPPAWWKPGQGGKCRCQTYWGGLRTIHCVSCHRTFTAPAALDKHRRDYECLAPAGRGLVESDAVRVEFNGRPVKVWGFPADERWDAEDEA
jgi:hypothetical protein